MNQLEAMREARLFQHLAGVDEIGRVETELRVLTATGRPFAGTFAVKPDANADHRFDPDFVCGPDGLLEFLEFFNDDDNQLREFATGERDTNKSGILVSVADDEAVGV